MTKSNDTRLTETLAYLDTVNAGLSLHLAQILRSCADSVRVMDEVSGEISLSGQTPWYKAMSSSNSATQRDALRALLLCQRVYLTNMWSPSLGDLPFAGQETWPKVTLDYWRVCPERLIRDGILMYVPKANIVEGALADAAKVRSLAPDSYFTAKRNSTEPCVGNSCYDQVSHWLLAAGFVSIRWMMKSKPTGFDYSAFGAGNALIKSTDPLPKRLINAPRGKILRLFTDRRPGGHFMISDGDGWGWGYNNGPLEAGDGEPKVINGHARCLIHRQFAQYRDKTDQVNATDFGGKLIILDPAELPGAL